MTAQYAFLTADTVPDYVRSTASLSSRIDGEFVTDPSVPRLLTAQRRLAERNLLRGKRLGLPSGQDVAAAMGRIESEAIRMGQLVEDLHLHHGASRAARRGP